MFIYWWIPYGFSFDQLYKHACFSWLFMYIQGGYLLFSCMAMLYIFGSLPTYMHEAALILICSSVFWSLLAYKQRELLPFLYIIMVPCLWIIASGCLLFPYTMMPCVFFWSLLVLIPLYFLHLCPLVHVLVSFLMCVWQHIIMASV